MHSPRNRARAPRRPQCSMWCKATAFGDLPSVPEIAGTGTGWRHSRHLVSALLFPGVPARRARDRRCTVALGRRLRDDRAGHSRPLRRDAGADEQPGRETGRQRISRLGRRRHPPDRTRDNLSTTASDRKVVEAISRRFVQNLRERMRRIGAVGRLGECSDAKLIRERDEFRDPCHSVRLRGSSDPARPAPLKDACPELASSRRLPTARPPGRRGPTSSDGYLATDATSKRCKRDPRGRSHSPKSRRPGARGRPQLLAPLTCAFTSARSAPLACEFACNGRRAHMRISSRVRPLRTESGRSATMSEPGRAC
jgi:hypothetical protein